MKNAITLALLLPILTGCVQDEKIASLEDKLKVLEATVVEANANSERLKSRIETLELLQTADGTAYLTPSADGYGLVRTDVGQLTLKIKDVQPYADGSKVTLQIGNLSAAQILGLKATIEWGTVNQSGQPDNLHAKSREVTLAEIALGSNWTNSEIVLDGFPPTTLGFVRVHDISHHGIRFFRF